ncbi:hypothetical protein BTHE68_70380 (plasmid) [Burkholderia sp. THE68]|nr:hypothetical protein BTHE68_70380 [Burkholderia sp. THE68]
MKNRIIRHALNQEPKASLAFHDRIVRPALVTFVANHFGESKKGAVVSDKCGGHDVCPEGRAIPTRAPAFGLKASVLTRAMRLDFEQIGFTFCVEEEDRGVLPKDLLVFIPEDPPTTGSPGSYLSIRREKKNGKFDRRVRPNASPVGKRVLKTLFSVLHKKLIASRMSLPRLSGTDHYEKYGDSSAIAFSTELDGPRRDTFPAKPEGRSPREKAEELLRAQIELL